MAPLTAPPTTPPPPPPQPSLLPVRSVLSGTDAALLPPPSQPPPLFRSAPPSADDTSSTTAPSCCRCCLISALAGTGRLLTLSLSLLHCASACEWLPPAFCLCFFNASNPAPNEPPNKIYNTTHKPHVFKQKRDMPSRTLGGKISIASIPQPLLALIVSVAPRAHMCCCYPPPPPLLLLVLYP